MAIIDLIGSAIDLFFYIISLDWVQLWGCAWAFGSIVDSFKEGKQ